MFQKNFPENDSLKKHMFKILLKKFRRLSGLIQLMNVYLCAIKTKYQAKNPKRIKAIYQKPETGPI